MVSAWSLYVPHSYNNERNNDRWIFLLSTYTWYISIYDSTEVSKKSFFACVEVLVPRILFHLAMSNLWGSWGREFIGLDDCSHFLIAGIFHQTEQFCIWLIRPKGLHGLNLYVVSPFFWGGVDGGCKKAPALRWRETGEGLYISYENRIVSTCASRCFLFPVSFLLQI